MFVIIRIVFGFLIFIIGLLIIRRSHIVHKRKWSAVSLVVAVILTTISAMIPIENVFLTFPSPELAYHYTNSGDVKLFVDGEETVFVVGTKGDTSVYAIIPKSDNGWKLGMGSDTKRVVQIIDDGVIVYVFQYKDSHDYYIAVSDTNGDLFAVEDNYNSEFYCLDNTNNTLNKTVYTYYAYINDLNEQYMLIVNGKEISIDR